MVEEAGRAIIDCNAIKRPLTRESSAPIRLNHCRVKPAMARSKCGPARKMEGRRKSTTVAEPGFEVRRSCLQVVWIAEVDERRVARSARA